MWPCIGYPCSLALSCHDNLFFSPANTVLPMNYSFLHTQHTHTGLHNHKNTEHITKIQHTYKDSNTNMLYPVQVIPKIHLVSTQWHAGACDTPPSWGTGCVTCSRNTSGGTCAGGSTSMVDVPPSLGMWSLCIILLILFHIPHTYSHLIGVTIIKLIDEYCAKYF